MSEQKKVIHVKDLIIQADNVRFEPTRKPVDPIFGPRRRRGEGEDVKDEVKNVAEQKDEDEKNERRRPPFFWF